MVVIIRIPSLICPQEPKLTDYGGEVNLLLYNLQALLHFSIGRHHVQHGTSVSMLIVPVHGHHDNSIFVSRLHTHVTPGNIFFNGPIAIGLNLETIRATRIGKSHQSFGDIDMLPLAARGECDGKQHQHSHNKTYFSHSSIVVSVTELMQKYINYQK